MPQQENLLDVLRNVVQRRKTILLTSVIAAVLVGAISLLTPNYYKATTIFYAASADLAKPEQLFGTIPKVMDYYGDDHDNDRLFTIASSNELVDSMVRDFDLFKHYEIDTSGKLANFRVREQFKGLYSVIKTKYEALELTIEDTDPDFAAKLAKGARNWINVISQRLVKESQASIFKMNNDNIKAKEIILNSMRDTLILARKKYGIYNSSTQSEDLAEMLSQTEANLVDERARLASLRQSPDVRRDTIALIQAKVLGLEAKFKSISDVNSPSMYNITRLNDGKGLVDQLEADYVKEMNQLGYDKLRTRMLEVALYSSIPALHIIEDADTPLIKSRPKRSLWVLGAALAGFLFSVLGVLIQQQYRHVDWSIDRRKS
ncbi:MAG: hypothetical protein ABIV51_05005 [Saprospiraceae bacterium]